MACPAVSVSLVDDFMLAAEAVATVLEAWEDEPAGRFSPLLSRADQRTATHEDYRAARHRLALAQEALSGPAGLLRASAPELAPLVDSVVLAAMESGLSGIDRRASYPNAAQADARPLRQAVDALARRANVLQGPEPATRDAEDAPPPPPQSAPAALTVGIDDEGFLVINDERVPGPKSAPMRAASPTEHRFARVLLALADGESPEISERDVSELNGLLRRFQVAPAQSAARGRVRVRAVALAPDRPPPRLIRV
jgi:hypothetical protein